MTNGAFHAAFFMLYYYMNENVIQMLPADTLGAMPEVYRWGIELIKLIQRAESPALTAIMRAISAIGSEIIFLPMILFIFWCIDEKRGFRLGALAIVSVWLNIFLKNFFRHPRPFFLDPSLGLVNESGFGFPSGHAQLSLTLLIPLAIWLSQAAAGEAQNKKKLIWAGAVLLISLIAFSRLYLGVHFPTDILAGFFLGGFILVFCFFTFPLLERFFAVTGVRSQNICAALLVLGMNSLYPPDRSLPALFLGFCIGYSMMKSRFPFTAVFLSKKEGGEKMGTEKHPIVIMFFRCVIGFAGLAIIHLVLALFFPGAGSLFSEIPIWGRASPFSDLGNFARFILIGLWVTAGAPKVFQRMEHETE